MPASHAYPPYIEGIIFDATGKPAAGGTVEAYVAGSSVPTPLWSTSEPAVSLGPVVTIDGSGRAAFRLREGYAYKLRAKDADGALIWERDNVKCPLDGGGVNIPNPMESTGDMIVGGVGGQPERLAPGDEGDVLKVVSGVPAWAPDAEGMQNPMTEQGDMIVGAADGAPIRLAHPGGVGFLRAMVVGGIGKVLQWVGLNAGTGITIAQDGAGATISADEQEGDHKAQVSATDSEPNYLQNKVLGGDLIQVEKEQTPDGEGGYAEDLRVHLDARGVTAGYIPTADGSNGVAWNAPATQPGDHQLLVSATDASAGYLGAKLTAGSNVTLTPHTDGDGVQTLEISASGGGGGGSASGSQVIVAPRMLMNANYTALDTGRLYRCVCSIAFNKVTGFALMYSDAATKTPNVLDVGIYEGTKPADAVKISTFTRSAITINGFAWSKWVFDSPVTIDQSKTHWICVVTSQPTGARPGYIVGEYAGYTGYSSAVGAFGGYIDPASSCPNNLPTSGFSDGHFFPALTLYGEY